MHDHSLGGPVALGIYDGPVLDRGPLHNGTCYDGVYGCDRCHNVISRYVTIAIRNPDFAAEEGWSLADQATLKEWVADAESDTCELCGKTGPTQIHRVWDEPVSYALCGACRSADRKAAREELDASDY